MRSDSDSVFMRVLESLHARSYDNGRTCVRGPDRAAALHPIATLFFLARLLTSRVSAALRPSMWLPPSTVLMLLAKPTVTSLNESAHHWGARVGRVG